MTAGKEDKKVSECERVEKHRTATLMRRLGRTRFSWFRQLVPCFVFPSKRAKIDLNKERRNVTRWQKWKTAMCCNRPLQRKIHDTVSDVKSVMRSYWSQGTSGLIGFPQSIDESCLFGNAIRGQMWDLFFIQVSSTVNMWLPSEVLQQDNNIFENVGVNNCATSVGIAVSEPAVLHLWFVSFDTVRTVENILNFVQFLRELTREIVTELHKCLHRRDCEMKEPRRCAVYP
ncbi:uncharacterized protein LOC113483367 [Athene cunicularia]|uniref:uncharacterized protein LOC113483367 n=1 Tax=Athene cunicularia TaxID=194338 RepID=UPI000EF6DC27|nr:uncharacterized protein LOC113483367 [Athene cunicularia]